MTRSFFIINPTRCTDFYKNLFWRETLRVSENASAHHQESIHCTLNNGIYHTSLKTAFEEDHAVPPRNLPTKPNHTLQDNCK